MQLTKKIRLPLRSRALSFVRQLMPPAFAAAILSFVLHADLCIAQQGNEKTFASPGEATLALYDGVKAERHGGRWEVLLGIRCCGVLHTGDEIADKNMAAEFLRRYDQMHRVVIEPDQTATLYIGADNWPLPISIVKNSRGAWYFDTETGKKEILYRRVGTNENDAIDTLHGLVDAQHDYTSEPRNGDKTKHDASKLP